MNAKIKDRSNEAGAPEIEITPAMLKAGALELLRFDMRFEGPSEGARAIFEAMIAASTELETR